jgi:hypothetical protein
MLQDRRHGAPLIPSGRGLREIDEISQLDKSTNLIVILLLAA